MPRGGRKMKGGADGKVNIGGQEYEISTKDENGRTEVCVSVPKPKAEAAQEAPAEQAAEQENPFVNLKECDKEGAECEPGEIDAWNKAVEDTSDELKKKFFPERTVSTVTTEEGGKRRRGSKTAKKGRKSAKKGGKTGGTRKRGGRKGGKK